MRVFSVTSSLVLLFSSLFLASTTSAQSSVELTDGTGATADVLGQSGKITMSLNGESVQVTMDSMYESDASGNKIQTSGKFFLPCRITSQHGAHRSLRQQVPPPASTVSTPSQVKISCSLQ